MTKLSLGLLVVIFLFGATVLQSAQGEDDPRFKRPAGMTDDQYKKLVETANGKPMTDQQADQWWTSVQKWFSDVLKRLGNAAKAVGKFFTRLFGNQSDGRAPEGAYSPPPNPDAFIRRGGATVTQTTPVDPTSTLLDQASQSENDITPVKKDSSVKVRDGV
ncbi:hypothetical protein HDE_04836 [Halotydeus destructor]|nr:hypothetical protein HDE_04836 [Halotydeus destructor]